MARVGIVLGAGGLTGDAFHRGVLRALREVGYDPARADVLVGTSAGSYVAAALRRPGTRAARDVQTRGETVHGRRLGRAPGLSALLSVARRPWQARAGVVLSSVLPTGQHSAEMLVTGLRGHHGRAWPERTLYVCTVRRSDGRRVVFGAPGAPETDVARAVAASCAIPAFFHPVEIDGEMYVDGGVHSPTNADVVTDLGLDLVLVSSPMSLDPRGLRPALDVVPRLHAHRYLRRERRQLERAGADVVTFEPARELAQVMGVNPLHGGRIDEVERASYESARAVLRDRTDAVRTLGRSAAA